MIEKKFVIKFVNFNYYEFFIFFRYNYIFDIFDVIYDDRKYLKVYGIRMNLIIKSLLVGILFLCDILKFVYMLFLYF